MTNPELRVLEIKIINDRINQSTNLDELSLSAKLVDLLEENQPVEKKIIYNMRQVICDLSFKFYSQKYPQ